MSPERSAVAILVACTLVSWGTAARADDDLVLDLGGGNALELRRIPRGSFTQGSPTSEVGRESDETQRQVTITKSFWLGKAPVTRAQFARFVTETRHVTDAEKGQSGGFGWDGKALVQKKDFTWRNPGFPQKDEEPVVLVTFADANAFIAWASRKVARRVRLPTEAEWEYAARGGTTTPWYGASKEDDAITLGWFKTNAGSGTHPVGLKKPNAFGVFDMSGNVYEWCRDVYAPYPPGEATDPENTTNTSSDPERRVLRGGSWLRDPKKARSASRYRNTPGSRNADNGFRVAVDEDGALGPAPGLVPTGDFAPAMPVPQPTSSTVLGAAPSQASADRLRPSSDGMGWALIGAPLAAAGAAVGWLFARRKGRAPDVHGVTTRAGADGFWIKAPNLSAGSRVRYACIVSGVEVTDVVPLDGAEETFVYTGGPPSAIRITEVAFAGAQGYRSPEPSSIGRPAHLRPPPSQLDSQSIVAGSVLQSQQSSLPASSSDDSSFVGYPSAY